jgi:hypothetical protein
MAGAHDIEPIRFLSICRGARLDAALRRGPAE